MAAPDRRAWQDVEYGDGDEDGDGDADRDGQTVPTMVVTMATTTTDDRWRTLAELHDDQRQRPDSRHEMATMASDEAETLREEHNSSRTLSDGQSPSPSPSLSLSPSQYGSHSGGQSNSRGLARGLGKDLVPYRGLGQDLGQCQGLGQVAAQAPALACLGDAHMAASDKEALPRGYQDHEEKIAVASENIEKEVDTRRFVHQADPGLDGRMDVAAKLSTATSPQTEYTASTTVPPATSMYQCGADPGRQPSPSVRPRRDSEVTGSIRLSKTGATPPPAPLSAKRVGRTICGVRRRRFIVAMTGISVTLLIVLAVVLAVTLTGRSGDAGAAASGMLDQSSLSAMNWTDGQQAERSGVVYQHRTGALMMAVKEAVTKDAKSGSWTFVNITEAVLRVTGLSALDVLHGTPLAAATNGVLWNIYYLNSHNEVAEVYSSDPAGNWSVGEYTTRLGPQAVQGSGLAAVWQTCNNCSRSLLVLFQDRSSWLQLSNYTNGTWEAGGVVAKTASVGTGMGFSAWTDYRGRGAWGTDTNALRLYFAESVELYEALWGPETKFHWGFGNYQRPIAQQLSINPGPKIASITYGANGWTNNLVTTLSPDGRLTAAVWRGDAWAVQSPNITRAPAGADRFNNIATTQTMRLYAVAQGRIHVFRSGLLSPFDWVFEETIPVLP